MTMEIIKDLTTTKRMNEIISQQLLSSARGIKIQRTQKALIEVTKDNKKFDTVN